jgi:environmental stress-induced protein Ves
MWLRSGDARVQHRLDCPLEPFRFAGDMALSATLLEGASVDFNVMVRSGRWQSDVQSCASSTPADAADAALVLCWRGGADVHPAGSDAPITLHEQQALLWRTASPALTLQAGSPDSRMLLVRLRAMCQDRAA